jgi:hypothetical protein
LIPAVAISSLLLACTGGGSEKLAARSSESPPHDGAPITTDARVYYLTEAPGQFDAYALATYTNRTGKTVYFKRCRRNSVGPMAGVRRIDGKPSHLTVGAVWACVGGVPTGEIPPGGSLSANVWLGSAKSPDADPPDRLDDRVGTFRILFQLCRSHEDDSDDCELLDDADRQSNPFEIRFRT